MPRSFGVTKNKLYRLRTEENFSSFFDFKVLWGKYLTSGFCRCDVGVSEFTNRFLKNEKGKSLDRLKNNNQVAGVKIKKRKIYGKSIFLL